METECINYLAKNVKNGKISERLAMKLILRQNWDTVHKMMKHGSDHKEQKLKKEIK